MLSFGRIFTRECTPLRMSHAPRGGSKAQTRKRLALDLSENQEKSGHFCNGNRTEWSPIRSVIIRVINKIGRPRSESPICLITSMITDRIGDTKFCHQLIITLKKFVI